MVGKHRVHLVRNGRDQGAKEVTGHAPGGFFMPLNEGELRSAVDGDEEVQPALFGANLGDEPRR